MSPTHVDSYSSIEEFYAADERRRFSLERDFGVNWREGDAAWPHYRVSWVEATGELYAIRQGASHERGRLIVLGIEPDSDRLERKLAGWADQHPCELDWVRARLHAG